MAPTPSPNSKQPLVIKRRSDWANFMRVLGVLCLLLAGGLGLVWLSSAPRTPMLGFIPPDVLIGCGVIGAIHAFLFAFLIDVFTDIRWFVSKLVEKDKPDCNTDVLGLELVKIEPGTFTMGSPENEVDRGNEEGPPTRVTISKAFSMSKHEVTQEQYEAIMRANPSQFKGDMNLPVDSVSWWDATNFCAKLTEQERQAGRLPDGYVYRLPTEAEWEYACRVGTTTRFSYGDDPEYVELGEYAWYGDNSGGKTHPVGQKKPNPWGLYDMHGNLWEWCLDWYTSSLPGGSVTDLKGPSSGSGRVVRGGGWRDYAGRCRSAFRYRGGPVFSDFIIGFRPVLAPGQPGQ